MPTHYIPEKLIAVAMAETTHTIPHVNTQFQARQAFIVPEGSKMINSARVWAKRKNYHRSSVAFPTTEEAIDNEPMKRLRGVGCEHRGEGGMAYKVVTPHGYLVDLREEEFLAAFFNGRIDSKGVIKGSFVWSVGGNQMRIVEVGSAMYKERLAKGQKQAKKATHIKAKDLVVGARYQMCNNMEYWYAGRVRHNGKLKYGWWHLETGRIQRRHLVITTVSAVEKLDEQEPLPNVVMGRIVGPVYHYAFDGEVTWQDGTVIEQGKW